ncbi:MAG: hypothetical protein AB7G37_05975 [Solirubrobacteraceae bacterium]
MSRISGRAALAVLAATLTSTALVPATASAAKVTSLRDWKPTNTYYVRAALDGRTKPQLEPRAKVDHVKAGQWIPVTCQTTGQVAYGSKVWIKTGGLYVPDHYVKTYTDGFIPKVPRCGRDTPPPPPADSASYRAAVADVFGPVGSGIRRDQRTVAPTTASDDIVVLRWFIPNRLAGGRLLKGDGRRFSTAPAMTSRSRAVLAWEPRTGRTSFTVTPTHLAFDLPDHIWIPEIRRKFGIPYPWLRKFKIPASWKNVTTVPALRLDVKSKEGDVKSTDLRKRFTNEVWVGRSGSGLRAKVSLLNSVTNGVSVGAWSVDQTVRIERKGGRWHVRVDGGAYPAVEGQRIERRTGANAAVFRRKIDPAMRRKPFTTVDPGGGAGALETFSEFGCEATKAGGSRCDTRLGRIMRRVVGSKDFSSTKYGPAE